MLNQEDEMEKDLKTMMLSLADLEMEVIIDNCFKEFSFDLYVCAFYVQRYLEPTPWRRLLRMPTSQKETRTKNNDLT